MIIQIDAEFREWSSNYIRTQKWHMIAHPCLLLNDVLAKSPMIRISYLMLQLFRQETHVQCIRHDEMHGECCTDKGWRIYNNLCKDQERTLELLMLKLTNRIQSYIGGIICIEYKILYWRNHMCWWECLMLSMLNMFECDCCHILVCLNGYLGTHVVGSCPLSIMYKHIELEYHNLITVQEKKYLLLIDTSNKYVVYVHSWRKS